MKEKEGALRVFWIPQVPGQPFRFPVTSVKEGKRFMDVLADYDLFQLKHNIKPDYTNMGGLEVFEDGEWLSWCCDACGDDENGCQCKENEI